LAGGAAAPSASVPRLSGCDTTGSEKEETTNG
jgi:hypothetical protein